MSIYRPNGAFSLPATASFLPNNLSFLENCVSVVKFNDVFLSNYGSGDSNKVTLSPKTSVFQASLQLLHSEVFLVIASTEGTHLYMNDGLEMKFFLPIGVSASVDTQDVAFACGIASSSDGFIFTGTSSGTITVIHVPSGSGEGISFHSALPSSDFPVLALGASASVLACGNDNGDIFGFHPNAEADFARKCKFAGSGYPCTSIVVRDATIIAGFSLGNIRMYSATHNEMTLEVTAHARAIYGLCLHPSLPLLASCGEDQHLHVWTLDNFDLLSGHIVEHRKLTGVAFFPHDDIGVSAYDFDDIALYTKN